MKSCVFYLFITMLVGRSQAAVSTCYSCSSCATPCDGAICTSTVPCDSKTGTDLCYIGLRNIDGKYDQGCASSGLSLVGYSTYGLCNIDNCNPTNGLICLSSFNSSQPKSTDYVWCTGSNNLCYVALDSNGRYYQGCGNPLAISFYYYSRACTEPNCNTAKLSCYSCNGCLIANDAKIVCSSPDDDVCFYGYRTDGSIDQGCGSIRTNFSLNYGAYKKSIACSTDFCNLIPQISSAPQMKSSTFFFYGSLGLLIYLKAFFRK